MTTQKYKSLLVIIWALWAFHPCLAIDDVLRTAKRDAILAQITGAVRPKKQISLISFGAKGDGKKDCKPAFDKAMKRAAHMGGAHIVVPAGEYLLNGPIHFVSNVCLELQEGATLKFSSEPAFYLPLVKTSWEGTFLQNYSPFIYGYQLENVSIIGKGVIDGNAGTTFATWKSKQKIGQQLFAPHLFELSRQAVRKRDRQRHQRAGLAAGVAEHHTLIARAGFFRRAAVNPARDVRRLGVDADADAHVFGVKADDGHGIADLGDDLARNGFIVRHIR